MFQIHVIDRSNRSSYQAELERHYRIRHEIYVEERGWREVARSDGREIDAFDTPDATYLLGITTHGEVVAGSRLVPSLKPHLMSEVFPQVARGKPPRGGGIYEWTRIFIVPQLRSRGRSSTAAGIVYCGILEHCLSSHIDRLSVVCEPYWYERLDGLGWNPVRLGETVASNDGPVIGLLLHMTETALQRTREVYKLTGSVLYRPVHPPAAPQ